MRAMVLPDGERIQRLRKARDWSQKVLCAAIEEAGEQLSVRKLQQIEAGQRTAERTLATIARAFGVEPETLRAAPPAEAIEPRELRIDLDRLALTRASFVGRTAALRTLNEAWNDDHTRIVVLVAAGGGGKTSLLNHWIGWLAARQYRGARRVFYWSFDDQETGTTAVADCFGRMLRLLGAPEDPWPEEEAASRIVEQIRQTPALLVLDGLEAQLTPAQADLRSGALRSAALRHLLTQIAAGAGGDAGLCILASRLPVADVQPFLGQTVREIPLPGLTNAEGAEVLGRLGVRGSAVARGRLSRRLRGVPADLAIAGDFLRTVAGGDIRRWDDAEFGRADALTGGTRQQAMDRYERWLTRGNLPRERVLLLLTGLFDHPAEWAALVQFRQEPAIPGLTEPLVGLPEDRWRSALDLLRSWGLIGPRRTAAAERIDVPPAIRDVSDHGPRSGSGTPRGLCG